jgi:hypothetical protein
MTEHEKMTEILLVIISVGTNDATEATNKSHYKVPLGSAENGNAPHAGYAFAGLTCRGVG